jgi:kynurenine formamidase
MSVSDRRPPTPLEYDAYRDRFRNWGRWGEADQRGTLNFITPDVTRAAAALVREGRSVSLGRPLATSAGAMGARGHAPVEHEVTVDAMGCGDRIAMSYHGFAVTHIDALCHIFTADGRMYGGAPATDVTSAGAARNSIDACCDGIVTRGVLYDVPRHRGVPFVPAAEPVHGWELADIARSNAIEPAPGDAVVVRAGARAFWDANPGFDPPWMAPGIHASALEFLWETDAALLVWDLMEAPGQEAYGAPALPIHSLALPYMGLPLLDNADLEGLADLAAELDRCEFQFIVAPLVVPGGTGSPVNPLAVF